MAISESDLRMLNMVNNLCKSIGVNVPKWSQTIEAPRECIDSVLNIKNASLEIVYDGAEIVMTPHLFDIGNKTGLAYCVDDKTRDCFILVSQVDFSDEFIEQVDSDNITLTLMSSDSRALQATSQDIVRHINEYLTRVEEDKLPVLSGNLFSIRKDWVDRVEYDDIIGLYSKETADAIGELQSRIESIVDTERLTGKIILIHGPTGTGKTTLTLALQTHFHDIGYAIVRSVNWANMKVAFNTMPEADRDKPKCYIIEDAPHVMSDNHEDAFASLLSKVSDQSSSRDVFIIVFNQVNSTFVDPLLRYGRRLGNIHVGKLDKDDIPLAYQTAANLLNVSDMDQDITERHIAMLEEYAPIHLASVFSVITTNEIDDIEEEKQHIGRKQKKIKGLM